MSTTPDPQDTARIARVIDLRIPLPWLLGVSGIVAWALVSTYFSVNQLVRDVSDMQITLKAGNAQVSTLTGEIALVKFRLENLEAQNRVGPQVPPPIVLRGVR